MSTRSWVTAVARASLELQNALLRQEVIRYEFRSTMDRGFERVASGLLPVPLALPILRLAATY